MRALAAIAFISAALFAQHAFEVATVKPNKAGDAISNHFDPERMSWSGVTLKDLIGNAYWLQPYQIVGGPAWLDADRWEINAKTEGPTTFQQKMELLGTLLADRFQHRETRELKAYRLLVAEGGPKLHEAKDTATRQAGTRVNRGLIEGHAVGASDLTRFLQNELGRPVEDATGLKGKYDFKLEWVPDEGQPNGGGEAPPPNAEGPAVFSAIREQLGLKLEARKGPVEVLVIDRAEKPGAN